MKSSMLVYILFCCYSLKGQIISKGIFINPSIGFFRVTNDKAELNNSPLMFEAKIGINVGKKDAIGLQYSSARQSEPRSGISNIQPPGGGNWTMYGTLRHNVTAIGAFYERYYIAEKSFTLFPSAYIQYLHYTDVEKGNIIVGTDSSMTYEKGTLHGYIGRVGINLNAQCNFSSSFSITVKFAQIDCRIWNKYEQHFFLELPLIFGVKYLFK